MLQEWTVLQTVAPTRAPINVQDVKQNLNLPTDYTQHDAKLTDLIFAATDKFENDTSRICMRQTFQLLLDDFGREPIDLYKRPIQSVESITYTDTNGDPQTVEPASYVLSQARRQVFLASGADWPGATRQRESVAVTFVAGVDEQSQVPRLYRQAISLAVGAWFVNPTDEGAGDRNRDQWENAYESIVRRFLHEKEM